MTDPDIVMATDFRFPGGTTASVVEELTAQHAEGRTTALLQLASPLIRRPRPFAARIRAQLAAGVTELVPSGRVTRTKLLVIRHPSVLDQLPTRRPQVEAEQVVLVVNQVPRDERTYYDVARVHEHATALFGQAPIWAPISPGVRAAIRAEADVPMTDTDWVNIIDLDTANPRTGFVGERPVIGRHGREHWSKWPATRADILAAYPDDPQYAVEVMGGAHAVGEILGTLPDNWTVHEFNAMPVPDFLARIDFHVYLHHPGLVEAFGRVVLEGLASGAVCFAPPSLEPIFGDAVAYGTPGQVRGFVDRLWSDPQEYAARSARGVEFVIERFSHRAHRRRIAELIGAAPLPATDLTATHLPATHLTDPSTRPITRPSGPGSAARSATSSGSARSHLARLGSGAPGWVRAAGRTGISGLKRLQTGLAAMNPPRPRIVTPPTADHIPADAPLVLVVIHHSTADPHQTVDQLVARAAESSAFRCALLAPPDWAEPAGRAGLLHRTLDELDAVEMAELSTQLQADALTAVDPATPGWLDVIEAAAMARKGSR